MRIVITGASGQVGRELSELRSSNNRLELIPLSRTDLDITSVEQCMEVLQAIKPAVVIHCAAYTNVDGAETNAALAYRINGQGTRNVAEVCRVVGAKLCYISSDYVFDGKASRPYLPSDPTGPETVYGKSKLAGEQAVAELVAEHYIVRTSWIYGAYGHNFVKTMLREGAKGRLLHVVNDQRGAPTYSYDLAQFLLQLVQTDNYGIYHAAGGGSCTWFEFAQAIFEETGQVAEVKPCATNSYPRPAHRPAYSVLATSPHLSDSSLRHWRDALRAFLQDCTPTAE